jgi:hypothetical protein
MLATTAPQSSPGIVEEGIIVLARRGTILLATAVIAVVALGGCASPGEPAVSSPPVSGVKNTPTSSEPSVVDAENTPAPSPAPIDLGDPSSWVITFDGIGPLTIGGRISEQRASMTSFTEEVDPNGCPLAVFRIPGSTTPHLWAAPSDEGDTVSMVSAQGGADPVLAAARSPKTVVGVGVGSSEAELLDAYPDISKVQGRIPDLDHYSLSSGVGRWIHFSIYGPDPFVTSITVNESDLPPYEVCG